ncbi:MAG: penicillin-binding transpeptidase domain-containing protein, partial [Patescibacteria group bacterium]
MKHGVAFGDFIHFEKPGKIRHHYDDNSFERVRVYFLLGVLILGMSFIISRLVYLQVFHGSYYRLISDNNRIKTVITHAPRGIIFDRNGTPLVYNIPGFRQTIGEKTKFISREASISLLAKGEKGIEIDAHRQYPYGEAFAHVLGYVGQVSKEELEDSLYKGYKGSDVIGKNGIEKYYQSVLVGQDGKIFSEVDNTGVVIRTLGQEDPISGHDITLTLDAKLQVASYNALGGAKRGAVVVTNPRGEVLAMVSKPSFDPNLFTLDETYKTASNSAYQTVEAILGDTTGQPLLDRAISGVYPPGSTFKLVTGATALHSGKIDRNYEVEDTGILRIGAFSFANWYFTQYGGKEGMVNIVKAIARSNDIFFYQVADLVGVDRLSEMAFRFGLGKKLGIDIGGEVAGTVPTREWKEREIGEQWYTGDTYHYGIGQGYLLTTPLQVNMIASVIANGGVLYQPRLLKNSKLETRNSKFLSDKNLSLIQQGMIESCSPGGVGWPLFQFKIQNSKFKIDN